MRVNKISFEYNNNYANKAVQNRNFAANYDAITFTQNADNDKKPTFFDKIRGLFSKKEIELTPEQEQSEKINAIIYNIEKNKNSINKTAKTYSSLLKGYLGLGQDNNWQTTAVGKHTKLLFSEREPDSLGKQTVTRLDMENGMKVKETYHVETLFGLQYNVSFDLDESTQCSMNVLDKRALSVTETDKETGFTKILIPELGGFYFVSGYLDKDGEISSPDTEIKYVFDDADETFFKEKNSDGIIETYKYNPDSKMWELQKEE